MEMKQTEGSNRSCRAAQTPAQLGKHSGNSVDLEEGETWESIKMAITVGALVPSWSIFPSPNLSYPCSFVDAQE